MKISLTMWQRLNLEGIMREKKSGDDDGFRLRADIFHKMKVTNDERQSVTVEPCGSCGLGRGFDPSKLAIAAELETDIDKAEARHLESLLKDWKGFTMVDEEWLTPLQDQLKKASAGGSVTEVTTPKKLARG